MTTESFVVPSALAGERLDRALALLTGQTRAEVGRAVGEGLVTIEGVPVVVRSRRLKAGELIAVVLSRAEAGTAAVPPADAGVVFDVVYADEDVVVVDKPVGLVVHPGAGVRDATLVAGLLARYPDLSRLPAAGCGTAERPGIVHRLDKETSGLLVVARSERAFRSLSAQLAARTVRRTYRALALGALRSADGVVDAPIGRSVKDPTKMAVDAAGREARTSYHVLGRFTEPLPATELELHLETGRTHQIRVHLAAIGHPVLGDQRYGGSRSSSGVTRLMLHATQLAFDTPWEGAGDGHLDFEVPPPEDYSSSLARFS